MVLNITRVLVSLASVALAIAHLPAAAQSRAISTGANETVSQNQSQSGSRSPYLGSARQSAIDAEVQAIMQMLRDEGIDIDARMARARAQCRSEVTAEAEANGEANQEAIDEAIQGCALAREGVVYAQAINEMNANRVNAFNSAMAQHNAQVAEANRKQREYEQKLQGHSAQVAEVQRKQQEFEQEQAQYERDLAAHRALLAERGLTEAPPPPRTRTLAQSAAPASSPIQTARAETPSETSSEPAASTAAAPPSVRAQSQDTALAQNSPPQSVPEYTPPARVAQAPPPQTKVEPTQPYTPPQQVAANALPNPSTQTTANPPAETGSSLSRAPGAPRGYGKRLSGRPSLTPQEQIELAVTQASGPRIALVIGNERYNSAMGSLSNPVNDAVLISTTLRSLGFDVEVLRDGSQREMKEAVRRLGDRLQEAGDNATGLFYYAGHGVQSQGQNFLIPVGSEIDSESDLELEAVRADAVLAQMEEAYVSTRIVILDACRNMPLRRRTRSGARGLARMETPNGSFVAYSTSPGNTAADGGGLNSPFAESLAEQMRVPDRAIEVTFREVRRQVVEMTSGDQVPWNSSSLLDTFSFARSR